MRVFVAIEISKTQILENIKKFQENVKIDAKPTRTDQIHFTLQFLGEINLDQIEQVKKALTMVNFPRFDLTIMNSGAFPNSRNPRVVWLGVDKDGGEKISNLASSVNQALSTINLMSDKLFKPHLTVFRIKTRIGDITNELLKFKDVEFGKQMVSQIVLKKSELSQSGPEYTNLGTVSGK